MQLKDSHHMLAHVQVNGYTRTQETRHGCGVERKRFSMGWPNQLSTRVRVVAGTPNAAGAIWSAAGDPRTTVTSERAIS
eukprot:6549405-Alexandrium_andersonii.AAC.1